MTILGLQTVAELRDLVEAKDYLVSQVQKAYDSHAVFWSNSDKEASKEWKSDWDSFRIRYKAARMVADSAFARAKLSLASESVIPAEVEYRAVMRALTINPDKGYSRGDFQDLYNRLSAVTTIDTSKAPQPRRPDFDLDGRNTLEKVDVTAPSNRGGVLIGGGLALAALATFALSRK